MNRNSVFHNGVCMLHVRCATALVRCIHETEESRNTLAIANEDSAMLEVWQNPLAGFIKINVDAAFVQGNEFASFGCVARDEIGVVLFGAVQK
ncbi:hypothetical protein REPUB_Repub03eG0030900 [Reevesia pubescens]